MRPFRVAALSLSLLCAVPAANASSTHKWDTLSTALAVGVPALAGVETLNQNDWTGMGQLAITEAATFASVMVLKSRIHEERPDGSGNDSFPSGHTAVTFAAARYLDKRYGGDHAWVMYGLSGLTGVARVEAKKHYWKDVVAGGLLGFAVGDLSTRYRYATISIAPTQGGFALLWRQPLE